jgi:hypothetical protein
MPVRSHHLPACAAALLLVAAAPNALAASEGFARSPGNAVADRSGAPEGTPPTVAVPGTNLGPIPDSTSASCATAGPARDIAFAVPALGGALLDLDVAMTFDPAHSWGGDITAVLIAPGGSPQHTLFGRVGKTASTGCGDGSDLAGPYVFTDAATPPSGGFWQEATAAGATVPLSAGSYFTTNSGGVGAINPMPATSLSAPFFGMTPVQMQGTWTLRLTDSGAGDIGTLSSATLYIRHQAGAAPIYDNGPLTTGNLTDSGVAAPAGYHWSEAQVDDDVPGVANTLAGANGSVTATVFRVADDFEVPPGQRWTLANAEVFAYQTGYTGAAAPFDFVSLRIWNGPPGEPGSTILCGDASTNVYQGATEVNLLRIFNTATPAPGTTPAPNRRIWALRASIPAACAGQDFFEPNVYWLDWNSRIPGLIAHFAPPVTVPGTRNRPGDNARQDTGSGAWGPIVDNGNPVTPPSLPQGLPFKLYGAISGGDTIFADGFD